MACTMLPSAWGRLSGVRYDLTSPIGHGEGTHTIDDAWGEWDVPTGRSRKLTFRSPSRLAARVFEVAGPTGLIEGRAVVEP